jgi:hypothetical protein
VRALPIVGVVLRGVVVTVRAVVVRRVLVVLRAAGVLVMAERHALAGCDRGHPLQRHGQREQHDGKNAEKSLTHRSRLYASHFVEDRAIGPLVAMAAVPEMLERGHHGLELGNARAQLVGVALHQLLHLAARPAAVAPQA